MELFHHDVNFDWMGKAKYFFALSLTLLVIGAASWIHKGSLDYGIDFKGGTLVYVRFAGTPPVDQAPPRAERSRAWAIASSSRSATSPIRTPMKW